MDPHPGLLLTAALLLAPPNASEEFFEAKVRPLLAERCWACHGAKKQSSSLRLDSADAIRKGGDSGEPILIPGKPTESRLLAAVRHQGDLKMPPKQPLSAEEIAILERWLSEGAVFPESRGLVEDWRRHWAFQPLVSPAVPPAADRWAASPIDSFVLTGLRKVGAKPAPTADRRTLLRRATYDLHGLPATLAELDAFAADPRPDTVAWAEQVDRLLASSRFGERWGRHWLDLARFADDRGYVGVNVDRTYPFAYTYRDWVIQSLNADLPYDQFIQLQVAADQLNPKDDPAALAALGFLTVGRRFLNNPHDIIDDRIDATFRTTLGLTVSCARCHDHKYDPITIKDYYGLYGVFASCHEPEELPLLVRQPSGPEYEAFLAELKKLEAELADFESKHEKDRKEKPIQFDEQRKPFVNRIKRLHAEHPGAPPRAMVLLDNATPSEPRVLLRGVPHNPGPTAIRQFLPFLAGEPKPFREGSGRKELAQALVAPENPLPARVWANRVWGHLFAQPLVRTPSDFGLRSDPPTHPELLDHLATQLIADGWSTKRLIRRILLSNVYQQCSTVDPKLQQQDPDNRLLGRMNRKRLDLEAMRDSLLFVSGRLDLRLGGRSENLYLNLGLRRRSVYGLIDRQNLPGLLRTFDFAIPDTHSPRRFTTTVAQQALFLLNSSFTWEQSEAVLALPEIRAANSDTERLRQVFRRVLAREPSAEEITACAAFLDDAASRDKGWCQIVQALLVCNEFMFVD